MSTEKLVSVITQLMQAQGETLADACKQTNRITPAFEAIVTESATVRRTCFAILDEMLTLESYIAELKQELDYMPAYAEWDEARIKSRQGTWNNGHYIPNR